MVVCASVVTGDAQRLPAASVLAAGTALGAWYAVDSVVGEGALSQLVALAAGLGAGGAVYLGAVRALGLRELEALLLLRARRDDGSDER
jgi:hypothetical protein